MHTYFINIGSNKGARRLNVARAVSAVGDVFGDRTGNPETDCHTSHIVETPAQGFESANDFLNIGDGGGAGRRRRVNCGAAEGGYGGSRRL